MNENDLNLNLKAMLSSVDKAFEKYLLHPPEIDVNRVTRMLLLIENILFPDFFHSLAFKHENFDGELNRLRKEIEVCLPGEEKSERAEKIIHALAEVRSRLIKDAIAIYEGDPAASSICEVLLCYPGFLAVMIYRISHLFLENGAPLTARIMTEYAHEKTGIDIHPGATIGESFCIDHGTGVVIGETARIGNRVKIYQGVTIGAKSFESDEEGRIVKGKKRHPDIGNDCIIYAGATILGGDTIIGDRSIIGGNVWLTHSLPTDSRVYYKEK